MKTNRFLRQAAGWAVSMLLGAMCVWADPAEEKKVVLRVARMAYVEGNVTMLRNADEEWTDATVNTPLMDSDQLYTGKSGRAEIQLDDEVTVRLGSDTFIKIVALNDSIGRIEVQKGSASIYATKVDYQRPPLEILTPTVLAAVLDHTKTRFDVKENGETEITVRRGEIQINKNEKDFMLIKRGDKLMAPKQDASTYSIAQADPEDVFDQWCDVRDAMVAAVAHTQYVTPRLAGYRDLDVYGDWVNTPEYGRVWSPRVTAVDWAPYRDGRWAWRYPYGWVWVSSEPWGWAPYHYGRWAYASPYGWCWVPTDVVYVGPSYYYRPTWYPALVSFAYSRHGRYFSLSVGSGYYSNPCVGWFPLGPADPYYPWYSTNSIYISYFDHHYYDRYRSHYLYSYIPNTNTYRGGDTIITGNNNTIVNGDAYIYQNQNVDNAVTAMPREDFESGNYRRLRPTTISRNPSPQVQVGQQALPLISERRNVVTKPRRDGADGFAAASNGVSPAGSNGPALNQPVDSGNPRLPSVSPLAPQDGTTRANEGAARAGEPNREVSPSRSGLRDTAENPASGRPTTPQSVSSPRTGSPAPLDLPRTEARRTDSGNVTQPRRDTDQPVVSPLSASPDPSRYSRQSTGAPRTENPVTSRETSPRRETSNPAAPPASIDTQSNFRAAPDPSRYSRQRTVVPRTENPVTLRETSPRRDSNRPGISPSQAPAQPDYRAVPDPSRYSWQRSEAPRSVNPAQARQTQPRRSSVSPNPGSYTLDNSRTSAPRTLRVYPPQEQSSVKPQSVAPNTSDNSVPHVSTQRYESPGATYSRPSSPSSIPSSPLPSRSSVNSYIPQYRYSSPRTSAPSISPDRSSRSFSTPQYSAPRGSSSIQSSPSYSAPRLSAPMSISPSRSSSYSQPRTSSPQPRTSSPRTTSPPR